MAVERGETRLCALAIRVVYEETVSSSMARGAY